MTDHPSESFDQFKNSFSYGSRTDLNFKFLKGLTEEDAADFLQQMLWKLGDAFDSGDFDPIREHVIKGQIKAYGPTKWRYEDGPFTPLSKPLSDTKVGLLTSTGHFVEGEDPRPFGLEAMTQEEAADRINDFLKTPPKLTVLPSDIPPERLRVRHGGYDIRGVQHDRNVALPIDRLRELDKDGVIGRFHEEAYSFVGACAQTPLIKKVGPQWVETIKAAGIEAMILVPV